MKRRVRSRALSPVGWLRGDFMQSLEGTINEPPMPRPSPILAQLPTPTGPSRIFPFAMHDASLNELAGSYVACGGEPQVLDQRCRFTLSII